MCQDRKGSEQTASYGSVVLADALSVIGDQHCYENCKSSADRGGTYKFLLTEQAY